MKKRLLLVSLILILATGLGWRVNYAQRLLDQEYFSKYGHWVKGEFLVAYYAVPNPRELYGDPITEMFTSVSGLRVQYFEYARFELHTDSRGNSRIELTDIGTYIYERGNPQAEQENSPACRLFPETGYRVCRAFLVFFDANGGAAQFGNPISPPEFEGERTVQYFERGRFEWRPELPTGERVKLGPLGFLYFYKLGEDLGELAPVPGIDNTVDITGLKLSAYAQQAIVGSTTSQTVYVIVRDQRLMKVSDAQVDMVVYLPSGKVFPLIARDPTDNDGVAILPFEIENEPSGVVKIEVRARYFGLEGRTTTSFRVWQ